MVETNGYLLETTEGNLLVDAPEGVAEWLDARGVRVDVLYLTHQHYDHVEDVAKLQGRGVRVLAWAEYSKDLTLEAYGASWGLPQVEEYGVDELVNEGEGSWFGKEILVFHVPGHSLDSIAFYCVEGGVLFSGDALFAGSVGRCDLPGGDFEMLIYGIREKILKLPDETRVMPGHGPETTVGRERDGNGYLR